jgi:hypothetical protein
MFQLQLFFLLHCDEWDRVVALSRHKFVTGATLLQLGQTKDYKIGICCFSAKNVALRSKSKDGLARNQNNVSE